MGRPELDVVQTTVQLTPEILRRLAALLTPHQRSAFIRTAVEKALDKAEKQQLSEKAKATAFKR